MFYVNFTSMKLKMNEPTDETIKAFEESLDSIKERKRQTELPASGYEPDRDEY